MYDHSFNQITLMRMLRKSDFRDNTKLYVESEKLATVDEAISSAKTVFQGGNPLINFEQGGKRIYYANKLAHELVLRKVCSNIKRLVRIQQPNRESIVETLTHLVSEGVPYRLFRLDIKSFYESFATDEVSKTVGALSGISPLTHRLVDELLCHFMASGGTGVPRGLALSATLADVMMMSFDRELKRMQGVYFYARYVDDIVIITNGSEKELTFLKKIKSLLPTGLLLHNNKRDVITVPDVVTPAKTGTVVNDLFICNYLGYKITVTEPVKIRDLKPKSHHRAVRVGIADSKIKKIKFRILRSLTAFLKDGDFDLLTHRIKYLTSNFSVRDINRDKNKRAGIYYSYPQITEAPDNGLDELDDFLRRAILNGHGRPFSRISAALSSKQKRTLLAHNFRKGHTQRFFVYFHPQLIKNIQMCWENG